MRSCLHGAEGVFSFVVASFLICLSHLRREQRVANETLNAVKIQKQADTIRYKDELIDGMQTQIQSLNDKISYLPPLWNNFP